MGTFRVGVLASGRGTDFQSLVDAATAGTLGAEIAVLVCNVPGAGVIARAEAAGIPAAVVDHRGRTREHFETEVVGVLQGRGVDLVVFAGFMRLVTSTLLSRFPNRVINIHPSLLPAFPGAHAHEDVLQYGAKVSGCTVHFVDESTDGGPILLQKAVEVRDDDTAESLSRRILEWEHRLLPLAVRLLAEGRVAVEGRRVRIDRRGLDLPPLGAE
jgi:phosphoribosylglycinamide formyltransferase-1